MKLFFDFFPIIVFFIIYKFFGIYVATGAFILACAIQILTHWILYRQIEKMHLFTFAVGGLLGAATLFFHNELFIKWKPTALYWLFAALFLASQFLGERPMLERMLGGSIELRPAIWARLNISWAVFFFVMGVINLYVVYHFDTNTWVNFKLFGVAGLTLVFLLLQGLYLGRHIKSAEKHQ
jgi:intracellular septation protein